MVSTGQLMDTRPSDREAETSKALAGLISNINRADGQSWQEAFQNSAKYIQVS
jgi:hypothetical protein